MSKRKTRIQNKALADFTKFVHATLRQMAAGEKIQMNVSLIQKRGVSLIIQTVAGHPNPPTPPTPGLITGRIF